METISSTVIVNRDAFSNLIHAWSISILNISSVCSVTSNPPYLKRWRLVHLPTVLAHENHKIAHKNAQKSFINFKPRIGNVAIIQGQISPPPPQKKMTLCVIGRVRFERNCGKMYSRHLFPYGGLAHVIASYSSDQTSVQCLNI